MIIICILFYQLSVILRLFLIYINQIYNIKSISKLRQMPESYKIVRSNGFNPKSKLAMPNNLQTKPQTKIYKNIQTYAILTDKNASETQQKKYEIHIDRNQKQLIMFDDKELISKKFDDFIILEDKEKTFKKGYQNTTPQKYQQFLTNLSTQFCTNNLIIHVSNENEKISDNLILGERQFINSQKRRDLNKNQSKYLSKGQSKKDQSKDLCKANGQETKNGEEIVQKEQIKQRPQWKSIIKTCYQNIKKNKKSNSIVMLSIIGIQSENILYDELNFQWIQDAKNQNIQPIPQIRKKRPALKIYRQIPTKGTNKNISTASSPSSYYQSKITAQNLTKQEVDSQDDLFDTLTHYHAIKNHISYMYNYDSYQLGQLYQLFEVEVYPDYTSIKNILQSCSILKINNYLINQEGPKKCNGLQSIQLRLGMLLKNYIINQTTKNQQKLLNIELHQSKMLFYLSNHFKTQNGLSQKNSIFLLNQIGRYNFLKEEIRNLTLNINCSLSTNSENSFTYCKNYIENKKWKKFVQQNSKRYNESQFLKNEKQTFDFQDKKQLNSKSLKLYKQSQKVKAKSFYYPTVSSSERNTLKEFDRLMFGFKKREQLKEALQTNNRSHSSPNRHDFTQIQLKDITKLNQYFKNSSRKNGSHVSCEEDQKIQSKDSKNTTSNQITGKKMLTYHQKWFSNLNQKISLNSRQDQTQKTSRSNSFKKSIVPPSIQQIYGIKNKKMTIRSINVQEKQSQKQSIRSKLAQRQRQKQRSSKNSIK